MRKLAELISGTQDSVIFDNPWLQMKEHDGYIYSHEIRCNGAIVLILPYRRTGVDSWEFLVRDETTPCWSSGPTRSAMTGGIEDLDPGVDAIRELKEEAGYTISYSQLEFLGKCRASKSSDTYYYLYTADLAGLEPEEALGDGSKNDSAPSVWISGSEVNALEDAQAITAHSRMQRLGVF